MEDVLTVGLSLPRAYRVMVRDRVKLRVGSLVFVAFSRDERVLGFAFPKLERDDLVRTRPETFFLPEAGDLRFN